MQDHVRATYDMFMQKLQGQLADVRKTKELLNKLAEELKEAIPFPDLMAEEQAGKGLVVDPDQFFNKPLATAVADYLKLRGKAVPFSEIVEGLRKGGFDIGKSKAAETDLRLSILKNTATFVLIGDNNFGLKEKYGRLKKDREKEKEAESKNGPTEKKRGTSKKGIEGESVEARSDPEKA